MQLTSTRFNQFAKHKDKFDIYSNSTWNEKQVNKKRGCPTKAFGQPLLLKSDLLNAPGSRFYGLN